MNMKVFETQKGGEQNNYVHGEMRDISLEDIYQKGHTISVSKHTNGYVFGEVENGYRNDENLKSNSAVTIDIDGYHSDVFDNIKSELVRYGNGFVLHTTHSHNPKEKKFCYRLIMPSKEPILNLEAETKEVINSCPTLKKLHSELKPKIDPAEKDTYYLDRCYQNPSQLYYEPTVHPDRKDSAAIYRYTAPPLIPKHPNKLAKENVSSALANVNQPTDFDVVSIPEGGRDNYITAFVGKLISQGMTQEEVLAKAIFENKSKCYPPLKTWQVEKCVDSVWRKEYKDKPAPSETARRLSTKQNNFTWQNITALRKREPIEWLISKHLIGRGVMFIYGPSQAGKTFLAVDLALSMALKNEWLGMPIKRNTPIRYAAFEDYSGVAMRVDGWRTHYGYSEEELGEKFLLGGEGSSLIITKEDSVENFIQSLGDFRKGIIFIDTLNKVGGGEDENSNGRMGLAISHAERISYATDSLVIIIHHTGKDESKGMRGATAAHGGADLIYKITRDEDEREVTFEKIKNGRDGHGKSYSLETVFLDAELYGTDDNETAIAVFKGDASKKTEIEKLTGNQAKVYGLIAKYLNPYVNKEDDYLTVVKYVMQEWVAKHTKKNSEEKNPKLKYEVERVIESLEKRRVIGLGSRETRQSRIWLIEREGVRITY